MSQKYCLIDGNHLVNRSVYSGLKFSNADGLPTGGVFLFLKSLYYYKDFGKPIVVFDGGRSQYRKDIFPDYKGELSKVKLTKEELDYNLKELVELLESQPDCVLTKDELDDLKVKIRLKECFDLTFITLKVLLPAMGIPTITMDGEEADDILFKLNKILTHEGNSTISVTEDEDYLQFVNFGGKVYQPIKDRHITEDNFHDIMGFHPRFFVIWKSLIGDDSDNINGIKGIGPAKASKIVNSLNNPDLAELHEKAVESEGVMWKKVVDNFALVKRNTLLIDIDVHPMTLESVLLEYNKAKDKAQVDYKFVETVFKKYEYTSLTNWLVHISI